MKIGILGAGTWGTALARLIFLNGNAVTVWSPIQDETAYLRSHRTHPNLPGASIPEEILFTSDIRQCCSGMDVIIFAVPSVYIRSTAAEIKALISGNEIIVTVSKGIEEHTLMTLSQVIQDELKELDSIRLVALSGPTHAEEVSLEFPSTIVAASDDADAALAVQQLVSNDYMRVYTNVDIEGVELCGALKNIVALAVGISAGAGYGDNAKAAVITRGIAEIAQLGRAMHCDERTFYGLAGVGDLVVTATSRHSRNNRAGYLIGQGFSLDEAKQQVGMVIEGVNALPAAMRLAERYGVEMPIITAVSDIIYGGASPKEVSKELLNRKMKSEYF